MPSCFSIQRTRVVERIPYLSLSLLGMTIWPFELTFDDVHSTGSPPIVAWRREYTKKVRRSQIFFLTRSAWSRLRGTTRQWPEVGVRSQRKADSRGLNAGSEAKPNDMGTRRKEAEYRGNGWNRSSRYGTFLHGASGGSTLAGVKYCQPDNLIFFVSDDYIVICQVTLKFTTNHDKMFTSGDLPDSRKPILSTAQDTRSVFHSLKNLQPQLCHRECRYCSLDPFRCEGSP